MRQTGRRTEPKNLDAVKREQHFIENGKNTNRPESLKNKNRKTLKIAIILVIILLIMSLIFAINNPQASFPWNNYITYPIYVIYLMITLLSTLYFPNKTEFLGNLYIIGFAVFPIIIFFYYILRLIRTVKLKFTKEKI